MSRKRNPENKGLPPRVCLYHGAFYYRVPRGQEAQWGGKRRFRLGKTLPEALRTLASHVERSTMQLATLGQLLDRYAAEVVPTKSPRTQIENTRAIARLKAVFGHMPILEFKPLHAYGYRDRRGQLAPTTANRELEVLSHAFTKAIEWGAREDHPMIEGKFRKLSTPPRDRYVEDWELIAALGLPSRRKKGSVRMVQAYLKIKLLTGRRRIEMMRLKTADLLEDGVRFELAKQRQSGIKEVVVAWSDALRASVQEALEARPVDISPWVFCNGRGDPYLTPDGSVSTGWSSIWQRFMDRVLAETEVKDRFTEHDIRAKTGSDAQTVAWAQELLAHTSAATTKRVYRRRAAVIQPLR